MARTPRTISEATAQGIAKSAQQRSRRAREMSPDALARAERRRLTLEEVARRREDVARLLSWGYNTMQIARSLNKPYRTIRDDVERVETRLQLDSLPTLQRRIARSVSVYQAVIQDARTLYFNVKESSPNKVGALNTIVAAQAKIDELQGTNAPDKVNTAAVAELYQVALDAVARVAGAAGQIALLKALNESARAGMNQLLLSGQPSVDSQWDSVDADLGE